MSSNQRSRWNQSMVSDQHQQQPLSPFQQWKLEDDLKFYATFPQARPATNQYTFQSSDFFGGAGFTFQPSVAYLSDDSVASGHSPHKQAESSLSPALHYNYGSSSSDDSRLPSSSHTYNAQPRPPISHLSHLNHNSVPSTPPDLSGPSPRPYHSHVPVHIAESHVLSPHQRSPTPHRPPSQPEPPIMDHLPPPSPPAPPSNTHMTHQASFGASPSDHWRVLDHVDTPWQYEPLPQPSVIRTDGPFSNHPLHPTQQAVYRSIRSQSHPNRHSIQPQVWPMVCTPSPTMQFNPLPSDRQLEKKPPLACLFCRGRKIACGPPEPGSEDPTCNQCQRRSIKCEYPSESRRGMRKKKSTAEGSSNTTGPKKPGKRSRSNG